MKIMSAAGSTCTLPRYGRFFGPGQPIWASWARNWEVFAALLVVDAGDVCLFFIFYFFILF